MTIEMKSRVFGKLSMLVLMKRWADKNAKKSLVLSRRKFMVS